MPKNLLTNIKYNGSLEPLKTIIERELAMVRSVVQLWVMVKNNIDEKYIPKNVTAKKVYPVVCEKSTKYQATDTRKENEELSFGIINDVLELVYVASFNLKVSENYAKLQEFGETF